jgi:hypothetical protein
MPEGARAQDYDTLNLFLRWASRHGSRFPSPAHSLLQVFRPSVRSSRASSVSLGDRGSCLWGRSLCHRRRSRVLRDLESASVSCNPTGCWPSRTTIPTTLFKFTSPQGSRSGRTASATFQRSSRAPGASSHRRAARPSAARSAQAAREPSPAASQGHSAP